MTEGVPPKFTTGAPTGTPTAKPTEQPTAQPTLEATVRPSNPPLLIVGFFEVEGSVEDLVERKRIYIYASI